MMIELVDLLVDFEAGDRLYVPLSPTSYEETFLLSTFEQKLTTDVRLSTQGRKARQRAIGPTYAFAAARAAMRPKYSPEPWAVPGACIL
jgi:hypothetical protein